MPPSMDPVEEKPKALRVTFYMAHGHKVVAENVKKIGLDRNFQTGRYDSYAIEWAPEADDNLFSLSVRDIVAVTSEDM